MGYRVEYGQASGKRKEKWDGKRVLILTGIFLLLFAWGIRLYWPEGSVLLRQILLPGEKAMVSAFMEDLKAGQPFSEAAAAFCREIIADAGVTLR